MVPDMHPMLGDPKDICIGGLPGVEQPNDSTDDPPTWPQCCEKAPESISHIAMQAETRWFG